MAKALEMVHAQKRSTPRVTGASRPKGSFDQMAAPVPEIMIDSLYKLKWHSIWAQEQLIFFMVMF
jgi:hypothetical protein